MSTIKDIDVTLANIVAINRHYSNRLNHFERIQTPNKSDVDELNDVAMDSQNMFIMKKQLCRSLIRFLPNDLQSRYELKLANLQTEYRECVTRKKEQMERCGKMQLFSVEPIVHPKTNDDYLNHAKIIEEKNSTELKKGIQSIGETLPIAINIGEQLTEDRKKIEHIHKGIDELESELSIVRKQITVFGKRVATDKILIMFAVLLILSIIGIIVYGTIGRN